MGQKRSSNDVCVTSAITPIAARKRTFRHFVFVPLSDIATNIANIEFEDFGALEIDGIF
jgi:hypothetical protein